jgi:hypothetical protein
MEHFAGQGLAENLISLAVSVTTPTPHSQAELHASIRHQNVVEPPTAGGNE